MLIGIDMLGVQSPEGGEREAGRHGRRLVAALLDRDPVNKYILYTHEGMPTNRVPSASSATRVPLSRVAGPASSGLLPTIQRLVDQNPDGLDWLLLLDPFAALYGGRPPETPLNGPRLASVVHDLASAISEEGRLAPLRRHDAILAVSEAIAADCRRRLGTAAWRVSTIGIATEPAPADATSLDPFTRSSGDELGRLGIHGPFLFASVGSRPDRANLAGILDAYRRLPIEHRHRHQLVIAGDVGPRDSVRAYLYENGCEDGLVLVGEAGETALDVLYGRCSAFLSPSIDEGSGQSLFEAMHAGAAILAGQTGSQAEIVGDAGLLVDPSRPEEIAAGLAAILGDVELRTELRQRALARASRASSEPVVARVLAALGSGASSTRSRIRVDRGHVARPRIAVFPDVPRHDPDRVDLAAQIPQAWREAFNVDLYLEAGDAALADGLPPEFGGFDARQFDRNDMLMSYHAVVHRCGDARSLESKLNALRKRPGLVFVLDEPFLDLIEVDDRPRPAHPDLAEDPDAIDEPPPVRLRDARAAAAEALIREVLATTSRIVVHAPRHADQIRLACPEFADQVIEIPPVDVDETEPDLLRQAARARLQLPPGSLVIGQFGPLDGTEVGPLTARAFRNLARLIPEAVLLDYRSRPHQPSIESTRPSMGSRIVPIGPLDPEGLAELLAALDLAIHAGETAPVPLGMLLRAGVPTIAPCSGWPDHVVRGLASESRRPELAQVVLELASDAEARRELGLAARGYSQGIADDARAAGLLIEQVETCSRELARVSGRRRSRPLEVQGPSSIPSPHFPRRAAATEEAASRPR